MPRPLTLATYSDNPLGFDEYLALVQRFFPPRWRGGGGRCLEVGGCEAGAADVAIGYDHALLAFRQHPLNYPYARTVASRCVH